MMQIINYDANDANYQLLWCNYDANDANYQLLCLILYLSALPIIELFYGTTLQSGGKFKMVKMLNVDTIFYISSIIFNQLNFYTKSYSS